MKLLIVPQVFQKRLLSSVVCGLCLLLSSPSPLQAALLPPGATLFPAPPEPDPTGGVVVAGGFPVPFASGAFSGTLTSTAITGDPSNPFGGLTFTYLLVNSAGSLDALDRLTISDFTGVLVDGSYQIPAAGIPPTLINRSATGGTVGFSFFSGIGPGEIAPGSSSALLVLQTSASTFAPTFASVINATSASVLSLAPAAVPEPSSLAFLGLGLLTLAACQRFSRHRA